MKLTIKLAAMAIILCLSAPAGAQFNITIVNTNEVTKAEPVDDLLFTVQYETTFVPDTLKPERTFSETMMLKIGKKNSVYYSYAKFLTDSVIEVDKKNGADIEVIKSHLQQYSSKINYKVHKNYPPGKLTFLDQLGPNRFRNEETTVVPRWTLLPDTMTVASYLCQKATCHLYGRTYEAWYTTDIPRSDGPWKLQGLPGLILKARDTRDHYTFQCTGIARNHDPAEKILFAADGYEPISRKDLNKMYARHAADPVGYATMSAPNVKVVIRGADGQPAKNPRNVPHNPIEKE